MNKEELVDFLKDNLKISIKKDICKQYSDGEYEECIKVSLYIIDEDYRELLIDSSYIEI